MVHVMWNVECHTWIGMIMNRMILNDTWIIQWPMESTKVHGMEESMEYGRKRYME